MGGVEEENIERAVAVVFDNLLLLALRGLPEKIEKKDNLGFFLLFPPLAFDLYASYMPDSRVIPEKIAHVMMWRALLIRGCSAHNEKQPIIIINGPMMDTVAPIVCCFSPINNHPPCERVRLIITTRRGPSTLHALLQRGYVHLDPPQVDPNLEAIKYGTSSIIEAAVSELFPVNPIDSPPPL